MKLFFGGGEIHRDFLQTNGVENIALSYMGLRRRTKFVKPWLIADKFKPETNVFLDSGAYTVNLEPDQDPNDLIAISDHYQSFVAQNLDRLEMVSEFDALTMGKEWIEEQRDNFYDQLPREKLMVVWHPEWGTPYLHWLAERYEIIGIPSIVVDGRDMTPILNGMSPIVKLHGMTTGIEWMQQVRWHSVASTSWVSPSQYGDTIIWTGKVLKRYPRKMKEEARRENHTLIIQAGFDAQKILDDDKDETLRLSIWSWLQFEKHINTVQRQGLVTHPFSDAIAPTVSETTGEVVQRPDNDEKGQITDPSFNVRSTRPLPGLSFLPQKDREGKELSDAPPLLHIRGESMRRCDTCFLAQNCPAYEPGATCLYSIPITVRTREERRALQAGLMEMQAQRVLFMQFIEQNQGGYADTNLTREMKFLADLIKRYEDMEKEGFELSFKIKGAAATEQAGAGAFSRIFGSDAARQVQLLEAPHAADDIIDAEFSEIREEVD